MSYNNPTKNMTIIGVTWTDGKTTTSNILHAILNKNVGKTAMISTALIKIWDETYPNTFKMTSLDPFKLWRILDIAKNAWCTHVVLEVASHAIHQHRFEGIDFDMAVLTNITPEHLDYHRSMNEYAKTKLQLFYQVMKNKKKTKLAVLPKDDEYWRKRINELYFDKMLSYSVNISSMLKWESINIGYNHTDFTFNYLGRPTKISMNLPGVYNVYNALAAIAAGLLLGIDQEKIAQSIGELEWVVGRMEPITHNDVHYFVDFAHTPNALKSAMSYINTIKGTWRSILVFGAPWNRDTFKRPEMGKIADSSADIIIVTDDDPDTEPRLKIIKDITKGITRPIWDSYMILPERENALRMAYNIARPWDIVLLAGKWHEHVQLTNFGKRPRSDKSMLEKIIKENK